MPRFKLTIEYDGSPYEGWQAQENGRGVQNAIERAIASMTGESVRLMVAGRTDAGVHALAQIAHADLAKDWRTDNLRDGLNTILAQAGERVSILAAEAAPETWNARLSAKKRHYLYRIINRRQPSPLEYRRAWHVPRKLDADAMNDAAQRLVGHHDFSTFRASACQARSPVKTLEQLDVRRVGDIIEVRTSARSFLHNQVRRMVGSLEMCGAGKWSADDLQAALEARDTRRSGQQAPAWGLYFTGVEY
ncbi:MAG: tRNA pseudouridine(38-40) synthase TruA [Beijerinckiaceae bacterium]